MSRYYELFETRSEMEQWIDEAQKNERFKICFIDETEEEMREDFLDIDFNVYKFACVYRFIWNGRQLGIASIRGSS